MSTDLTRSDFQHPGDRKPRPGRQLRQAVQQNRPLSKTGVEERVFSNLFRRLVYAQIWEDPVTDMAALNIGSHSNLVCIASGGCNIMSYLTQAPNSITAVDLSPAHVALNRLKYTAAQVLDYPEFYDFFGHANRRTNRVVFDSKLAHRLDPETLAYWTQPSALPGPRIAMFARGFYRYGMLGRFIGTLHLASRMARIDYRPLLSARSLADQQRFFDDQIAPLFERRIVKALARQKSSLFGLGIPPQQYEKLASDGGGDVLPVLRERVRKLVCDFPIGENYFAWQAFHRGYDPSGRGPVPPYLEEASYPTLQANAHKAQIHNRALTDVLAEAPSGSRHGYTLLDAQDWMTDQQLTALWAQILRTAAPGARVVFRTGGIPDILPGRVPADILERFRYLPESVAWGKTDRSAIYGGFHVYERLP